MVSVDNFLLFLLTYNKITHYTLHITVKNTGHMKMIQKHKYDRVQARQQ